MEDSRQEYLGRDGLSVRLGGWLFTRRGFLPLLIFAWPFFGTKGIGKLIAVDVLTGLAMVATGEAVRLWAAGHIGGRSRSRHGHVRELITGGPYGIVRNPVYIGNGLQWMGIGLLAGCRWYLAVVMAAFLIIYSLIIRWEEKLLENKFGDTYTGYRSRVPRWLPKSGMLISDMLISDMTEKTGSKWDRKKALRSERSTFYSLTVIISLLLIKLQLMLSI